jgi:hypothetical protein
MTTPLSTTRRPFTCVPASPITIFGAQRHTRTKEYAKAVQDYNEAIRLQPNSVRAHVGRARIEDLLGDTAGAEADRRFGRGGKKK